MKLAMRLALCAAVVLVVPACGDGDETTIINGAPGTVCIGLVAGGGLITFPAASPGSVTSYVVMTGLVGGGEFVVGIDYRPANGVLYAFSFSGAVTGNLYTVNPTTGAATLVGSFPLPVNGQRHGTDFNPVSDRLREVNSGNENLRVNPDTGGIAGDDTNLTFTAPATGAIVAAAYTNNVAGATVTTLYAIDNGSSRLCTIGGINGSPSPNGGVVMPVGLLGVTLDGGIDAGFDISPSGTAYAALTVGGITRLYLVSLTNGSAFAVGTIGDGTTPVLSLAVVP